MKFRSIPALLVPLLILLYASHAWSQITITFDDLPEYAIEHIPSNYVGIQWDNFWFIGGGTYETIEGDPYRSGYGYQNGIVSPRNIAFNAWGSPAEITSPSPFYLNAGFFTAAFNDGLQLQVHGFLNTSLAFDNTYTLNPLIPTFIAFDSLLVNRVVFTSSGGVSRYGFVFGDQFAMDNLSITIVPEPGTTALSLTAALLGVGFARKRAARHRHHHEQP